VKKLPALSPTSWLTAKTVFSQIFAIALFAIQAPLLGPRAFGLISIVMVFVGFCEVVLGDAVSESLISIRQIDTSHFDTMNTVILLVSLICGAIVFFAAVPAAHYLATPNLRRFCGGWRFCPPSLPLLPPRPLQPNGTCSSGHWRCGAWQACSWAAQLAWC
jgi:hypothetical protein